MFRCMYRVYTSNYLCLVIHYYYLYIEFGMVLSADDRRENRQRKFQNEKQTNRIFLRTRLNGVSNCIRSTEECIYVC